MNENIPEPIRAKIRRWYVPDAVYFIVGVTKERRPIFADAVNVQILRTTMRIAKTHYPFEMRAYVFMPDHFHLLIFVPDTTNISKLLHSIERNFTLNYKKAHKIATPAHIWQRGFWDHVIRDEVDYANHIDYIHYNPVKHGCARRPLEYAHSSFHEYVRRGWYEPDWGSVEIEAINKLDFE